MRKARIVCTIGPATGSRGMLEKLLQAGMDVARLNMSHGTHEDHRSYIAQLRAVSRKLVMEPPKAQPIFLARKKLPVPMPQTNRANKLKPL